MNSRARSFISSGFFVSALFCAACDVSAQDQQYARLVIVGEADGVLIGQDGYCGDMDRVTKSDLQKIKVPAEKRTWIRRILHSGGKRCELDFSVVFEPNNTYIVRFTELDNMCLVETFKVVPGADPVRHGLTSEKNRSCLLPGS